MKIGYIRVSTKEQNDVRQVGALKALGVGKIFSEKLSGKDTNRPQLKELLNFARKDDTVYIESTSRLVRSTRDFL